MFEKSVEELTELGAQITTAEIAQQPELWRDTLNIYRENKEAIEAFLAEARAMGGPSVRCLHRCRYVRLCWRYLRPVSASRRQH